MAVVRFSTPLSFYGFSGYFYLFVFDMILHIFNPSHDEALAANTPYYTPGGAARRLMADLSHLPLRWAAAGDAVLLSSDAPAHVEGMVDGVRLVRPGATDAAFWQSVDEIRPWGWDVHVCRLLLRAGAPGRLLPSAEELAHLRRLSSRQTAVKLLPLLREQLPGSVGSSRWCTDADALWSAVADYGTAMLKAPWSCSGRGVFSATPEASEATRRRALRILREQGAIEVEPLYGRLMDFAMEFDLFSAGAQLRYLGLSLFLTDPLGRYGGNLVLPEAEMEAYLPTAVRSCLPALRQAVAAALPPLIVGYVGPLGVDMMVVRGPDGQPLLHPCVEINLRHTMGRVAIDLRKTGEVAS